MVIRIRYANNMLLTKYICILLMGHAVISALFAPSRGNPMFGLEAVGLTK